MSTSIVYISLAMIVYVSLSWILPGSTRLCLGTPSIEFVPVSVISGFVLVYVTFNSRDGKRRPGLEWFELCSKHSNRFS